MYGECEMYGECGIAKKVLKKFKKRKGYPGVNMSQSYKEELRDMEG